MNKIKNNIKKYRGFYIFLIAVIFNVLESLCFGTQTSRGFNLQAQSIPELICDSISIIGMVLGMVLTFFDCRDITINIVANEDINQLIKDEITNRDFTITK